VGKRSDATWKSTARGRNLGPPYDRSTRFTPQEMNGEKNLEHCPNDSEAVLRLKKGGDKEGARVLWRLSASFMYWKMENSEYNGLSLVKVQTSQ